MIEIVAWAMRPMPRAVVRQIGGQDRSNKSLRVDEMVRITATTWKGGSAMLTTSTSERLLACAFGADHSGCPVAIANADPWWEDLDRTGA
jgi:hypothetical protein